MIALKHILMLARSKGYMDKDIFANYKLQSEFVTRNYLTMEEITRMMQYESEDLTLQLVRDTFCLVASPDCPMSTSEAWCRRIFRNKQTAVGQHDPPQNGV